MSDIPATPARPVSLFTIVFLFAVFAAFLLVIRYFYHPTTASAFNATPVRFTGISGLRVKECDRISALSQGLNAIRPGLGREEGDELVVEGDPTLAGQERPCRIDTHDDHRIAMAFALAGLKAAGIVIQDPDCVAKTYPGYWDALASLGVELTFGA